MTERFRVSTCKKCGAGMIWARTGRGKKMPLDAEPTSAGQFVLEGDAQNPTTYRLANYAASSYTGDKYTSHFSTCPNADDFRQKPDGDAA